MFKDAKHYQDFLSRVASVVNAYDPIKLIAIGAPLDEYLSESSKIVPLVHEGMSSHELAKDIRQVFVRSFSEKMADELPMESYEKMAEEILDFFK